MKESVLSFEEKTTQPWFTHFHTLYWKNILEPRGDRVIIESALYRTEL